MKLCGTMAPRFGRAGILALAMMTLALAACPLCAADDLPSTQPAATEPSAKIASLIAQLDNPNFGLRELAEKKLSDMGPAIEPELRDALRGNLSDEARARIDALVARFQEAMALHAMVTMHYTNAPLMKVLADFAQQAGGNLGIGAPSVARFAEGRSATINLDHADFWTALCASRTPAGFRPGLDHPACPSPRPMDPSSCRSIFPTSMLVAAAASSSFPPTSWKRVT